MFSSSQGQFWIELERNITSEVAKRHLVPWRFESRENESNLEDLKAGRIAEACEDLPTNSVCLEDLHHGQIKYGC